MLLEDLPDEILQLIVKELDFQDVYNLRFMNQQFYSLIKQRKLIKIPCRKFWSSYSRESSRNQECGVWISDVNAKLLNLEKTSYHRKYNDNISIKEVMKYWLKRFEFEGSFDLSFPFFDDELFELFYKHRRQFRKCSRFTFTFLDFQLSQDNLKKFLRMSEQVKTLTVGDCIESWKIISLEVLDGLNIPDIDVASDEDHSYMDDIFLEKIVFPSIRFYLSMELETKFTMKKLIDYLEIGPITDQRWKFGIIILGDRTWVDALNRIEEIGENRNLIVESWPTDDDMHRIFIHHEEQDLHISAEVAVGLEH